MARQDTTTGHGQHQTQSYNEKVRNKRGQDETYREGHVGKVEGSGKALPHPYGDGKINKSL